MVIFRSQTRLAVVSEGGRHWDAHPVTDASSSMMVTCCSGAVRDGCGGSDNDREVVMTVWRREQWWRCGGVGSNGSGGEGGGGHSCGAATTVPRAVLRRPCRERSCDGAASVLRRCCCRGAATMLPRVVLRRSCSVRCRGGRAAYGAATVVPRVLPRRSCRCRDGRAAVSAALRMRRAASMGRRAARGCKGRAALLERRVASKRRRAA